MKFDPTGKQDCLMLNSEAIYRYIHAGQGEVTLVAPKSLHAHRYAFLKPSDARKFPEDTIFVYVFHNDHMMYLGMLSGPDFRRTSRSRYGEDTEAVRGARYIVKMANRQDLVNKRQMDLYHSSKCCYCGKKLRSEKSLVSGIGRKCLRYYEAKLMEVPWDGN